MRASAWQRELDATRPDRDYVRFRFRTVDDLLKGDLETLLREHMHRIAAPARCRSEVHCAFGGGDSSPLSLWQLRPRRSVTRSTAWAGPKGSGDRRRTPKRRRKRDVDIAAGWLEKLAFARQEQLLLHDTYMSLHTLGHRGAICPHYLFRCQKCTTPHFFRISTALDAHVGFHRQELAQVTRSDRLAGPKGKRRPVAALQSAAPCTKTQNFPRRLLLGQAMKRAQSPDDIAAGRPMTSDRESVLAAN